MSERDADKWGKTLGDVLDALLWCHETHCPRVCSPGDRVSAWDVGADHLPQPAQISTAQFASEADVADDHVLPSKGHIGRER